MRRRAAPLKRSAQLARKTRVNPRRATPRRSSRVVDPAYLDEVRNLPCCSCLAPAPSQAHHAATWKRGLGQKCSDDLAVPLCTACHQGLHDKTGRFAGYTREQTRLWAERAIERTQADVAARRAAAAGGVAW